MGLAAAAGIAAVGTIGGAVISGSAANKAANTQAAAANRAADLQMQQYQQTREDQTPWREAGGAAIKSLADMLKPGYDHTTSPGYQFRFSEGQRAIESSAASKGMQFSGGTLKDLVRFGQGIGADDYNDQFNRTASVAAGGQQVNSQLGSLGMAAAQGAGNAMMGAANARASGYMGTANAINGAMGNLASIAMTPGLFGGGSSTYARLTPSASNTIASNPGLF